MLRARPTHWFELITSRPHLAVAMQTLADTGAVELQAKPVEASEPVLPHLQNFFDAFHELEQDYGAYWPRERGETGMLLDNPIAVLQDTLAVLRDWAQQARPLIAELQAGAARRTELELIARLVDSVGPEHLLPGLSGSEARLLARAIFFLPGHGAEQFDPGEVLAEVFPTEGGVFVIALGDDRRMAEFHARLAALKATPVPVPDFLASETARHPEQVAERLGEAERQLAQAHARLDELSARLRLADALARVAVLEWLFQNSGELQATAHTLRITGWTDSADAGPIRAALDRAEVLYVLNVTSNGPGDPPLVLDNPRWLKAFEFFPRLLGVPGLAAVDPSAVTAAIAPVLFGFMFGDVGQGAVLLLIGLTLSPKMPFLRLLIPGGLAAMAFGVLFGSVFSLEHVIPALWLHPLDEPITVLVTSVLLGVLILLTGVALDALQAVWRRQFRAWLMAQGGLVLAYLSLLGAVQWPALLVGLPVGIALTAALARDDAGLWSLTALGTALAEFVEGLMRLFVSTVSFARVGAFALAHAGLSAAITGVGEAAGAVGFWVVLLLGNVLIIGLEGLVTGIQTTRLVLFEFFVRFFRAEGREFRPLSAPGVRGNRHVNGETPT